MVSQLDGLQMIKKERDLPLFAAVSFDFLAGLPRPVPLISTTHHGTQHKNHIYNQQWLNDGMSRHVLMWLGIAYQLKF